MDKRKYKHIVFDLDGTLIDSEEIFISSLEDTLLKFGFSIDERLDKSFGLSQKGIEELYEIPESIKKDFFVYWYMLSMKPSEFKESAEALSKLKERGYIIGIVSSRASFHIADAIKIESFSQFVDIVFGSDKSSFSKPHPEPLIRYMSEYGLNKSELLYIGDLDTDRMCAESAGVDFAYAGWSWENKVEKGNLTFFTFQEMLDYLL